MARRSPSIAYRTPNWDDLMGFSGRDGGVAIVQLYCILVSGFNEDNNNVLQTAIQNTDETSQEFANLRNWAHEVRDINSYVFNNIPWFIRWTALYCLVYTMLLDQDLTQPILLNLSGWRISANNAIATGWAYCSIKYFLNERDSGMRDTPVSDLTINIIATACTNIDSMLEAASERGSVFNTKTTFNRVASDIVKVANFMLRPMVENAILSEWFSRTYIPINRLPNNTPRDFTHVHDMYKFILEEPLVRIAVSLVQRSINIDGGKKKQSNRIRQLRRRKRTTRRREKVYVDKN